jgi:ferrous iron transport protein A
VFILQFNGADGGSVSASQEIVEIMAPGSPMVRVAGEEPAIPLAGAYCQNTEPVLPLGFLLPGEKAVMVSVQSGRHSCGSGCPGKQALYRFEEMGLRRGKSIQVLNNSGCGLILIKVDETRIALGRGAAMKIMVRRLR